MATESLFNVGKGFSISEDTEIICGSVDLRTTGYEAPISSLYLYKSGGGGSVYIKVGSADTDWELVNVGVSKTTVLPAATETTADTILIDDFDVVEWLVMCKGDSDPGDKEAMRVIAVHDGDTADASNVIVSQYSMIDVGDDLGITITVDLSGSAASQVARLRITSTTASNVTVSRRII